MTGKVRKVDFSPDEFIAGTVGMTPEEVGVYWIICSLIYSSGAAIPKDDPRLRVLRCDPRTTRAVIAALVSQGKIDVSPSGEMMVRRCRKELERAATRIQQAAENGARGGRPAAQTEQNQPDGKPEAISSEKLSPPSPPSPSVREERLSRDSAGVIPLFPSEASAKLSKPKEAELPTFPEWYAAFPLHVAREAAAKAYRKMVTQGKATPPELLAGAQRYAVECAAAGTERRYTAHPAKWLNDGRWNDEPATSMHKLSAAKRGSNL
jgi:uncharacterized protein YdaU (DUF1376 family)